MHVLNISKLHPDRFRRSGEAPSLADWRSWVQILCRALDWILSSRRDVTEGTQGIRDSGNHQSSAHTQKSTFPLGFGIVISIIVTPALQETGSAGWGVVITRESKTTCRSAWHGHFKNKFCSHQQLLWCCICVCDVNSLVKGDPPSQHGVFNKSVNTTIYYGDGFRRSVWITLRSRETRQTAWSLFVYNVWSTPPHVMIGVIWIAVGVITRLSKTAQPT